MKKFFLICGCILAIAVAGYLYVPEVYGTACGIGSIGKSFDPIACTQTITWTTSASTDTNYVSWGAASGCQNPSYPNTTYGTNGTSHTVVIDCTDVGPKIAFKIHSSSSSCSEETGCMTAITGPCAGE